MAKDKDAGVTPDKAASALELEVLTFLIDRLPRLDSEARKRVIEYAARLHADTSKRALLAAEKM